MVVPTAEKSVFTSYHFLLQLLILPVIKRFLRQSVKTGYLRVLIAKTGEELTFGDETMKADAVTVTIVHPVSFLLRLLFDPRMGLGEAYMAGEWSVTPSLQAFFNLLIRNKPARKTAGGSSSLLTRVTCALTRRLGWLTNYMFHLLRPNTILGSRRNIREHYDLGNDMFQLFLDESMTYSCGFFNSPQDTLHKAQLNKLDEVIDKLQLKATDHVLEIGFGWGSCAIRAVQRTGCRWTGLTISEQQLEMAQERVRKLGLQDRIELKFLDYRLEEAKYDKVVAIEMIEAVGHEYLPTFFATIRDRLKPGGQACLQCITIPDSQYDKYTKSSDFIRKHIFPGGHLPCLRVIGECLPADLKWIKTTQHGRDYSTTLDMWNETWLAKKAEILKLGYSDVFFRKWQYYFCLCSSLFASDYIDTIQILLKRDQ
uniref:Cyclopropane-fatty-acyl-phospholipid synthase n=1 Tax=Plectus sambesii TaxID=2011161 RepID=A0A914WAX1_9BILA